jgi:hypothetical protein
MIKIVVHQGSAGGVYDFSKLLVERIYWEEASIIQLTKQSVGDWEVNENDIIVLQMSGYGYSRRGVPMWLLSALKKRKKSMRCLGIYFHEISAFGPPWTSSFWLMPFQKWIARELVKLSDFWQTNNSRSAGWLANYSVAPNSVLPVFSNVGELEIPVRNRRKEIVVFGGPATRSRAYAAAGPELNDFANKHGFVIHDIGPAIEEGVTSSSIDENNVVIHGELLAAEVSKILESAMFGLLAYPMDSATKSGVLAAYASHGLCPVVYTGGHSSIGGLLEGRHYLSSLSSDPYTFDNVSAVGKSIWEWYQGHNVDVQLEILKKLCSRW